MIDETMRYFRIVMDDGSQQVIRRVRRSDWTDAELCDIVKMAHEAFTGEGSIHTVLVADEEDYLQAIIDKNKN